MEYLTLDQMREIDGEGFWSGFLCGGSAAVLLGMAVSPDPFTKLAWGGAASAVIASCGAAFF